jgi:hypothetical protein
MDQGTEFKNKAFDTYLAKHGTKHELTVHDTVTNDVGSESKDKEQRR